MSSCCLVCAQSKKVTVTQQSSLFLLSVTHTMSNPDVFLHAEPQIFSLQMIQNWLYSVWNRWKLYWQSEGVAAHMVADGVQQRLEPFVGDAVVFWLDQQVCALTSLQLQSGGAQIIFLINILSLWVQHWVLTKSQNIQIHQSDFYSLFSKDFRITAGFPAYKKLWDPPEKLKPGKTFLYFLTEKY